jgi:hypothetical protein
MAQNTTSNHPEGDEMFRRGGALHRAMIIPSLYIHMVLLAPITTGRTLAIELRANLFVPTG